MVTMDDIKARYPDAVSFKFGDSAELTPNSMTSSGRARKPRPADRRAFMTGSLRNVRSSGDGTSRLIGTDSRPF